jgi:hypothetical protein
MTLATKGKELNVKQIVSVSGWLTANADAMKRSTRSDRCEAILKAVNIQLTDAQLGRIERELGFEFKRSHLPKMTGNTRGDRCALLAVAVIQLYNDCGSGVPEFVRLIARRESVDEVQTSYDRFMNQKH